MKRLLSLSIAALVVFIGTLLWAQALSTKPVPFEEEGRFPPRPSVTRKGAVKQATTATVATQAAVVAAVTTLTTATHAEAPAILMPLASILPPCETRASTKTLSLSMPVETSCSLLQAKINPIPCDDDLMKALQPLIIKPKCLGSKTAATTTSSRQGPSWSSTLDAPEPLIEDPGKKAGKLYERGVASWYGAEHHGSMTASGERFNMWSMTAAHRRLPFNTMVRVTNESNGKSCILRINDRGPYTGGRKVDLSRAGASAIGMIHSGVARVKIEVLDKASAPKTVVAKAGKGETPTKKPGTTKRHRKRHV